MSKARVLLLIAAFLTLTVGSFIYYIVTWDNRAIAARPSLFILAEKLPPEAPTLQESAVL